MSSLFDPARLPARDELGYLTHPDLPEWGEGEDGTPLIEAMGFEARFIEMDGDAPDEVVESYCCADPHWTCHQWNPTSPGPGWMLAGIWDTESGPVALFVRRQLTFGIVTKRNLERCNRWHPGGIKDWSPERWYAAHQGELGEVAGAILLLVETVKSSGEIGNALKKLFRVEDQIANLSEPGREIQSREQAVQKIGEELADTFLYLNLLASRLDISLEEEVVKKFNSVSERYGFPERL